MAFAIPSDDESQTLSKLNVYDIFAPTTKPMHDVRFEVDF